MIDIVFSDSACGSLKAAQHYGDGEYHCGAIGVIVHSAALDENSEEDMSPEEKTQQEALIQAEIEKAKREIEEKDRLEWEKSVPMGGNPEDIFGFGYFLSMGDISENIPGTKRFDFLKSLYDIYPDLETADLDEDIVKEHHHWLDNAELGSKNTAEEILHRVSLGEDLRIWYSECNPEDMCGLYWLMYLIKDLKLKENQINVISLPCWDVSDDGTCVHYRNWGEVSAGMWHSFLDKQRVLPIPLAREYASRWAMLREENSPMRAIVNGQLMSVPEDFYDFIILREIDLSENKFNEAYLIGKILGKYELSLSDSLLARRIETMIDRKILTPLTKAKPGNPVYHRMLQKC